MDMKALLVGVATLIGTLCTFAALVLYAMSKIGESSGGGVSEAKMVGCAVAAVAAFAAATWLGTQSLTISA